MKTNWQIKKLGEICNIQTGKWDANHAVENGKYRFYTCAYEYMFCDTKRFSGECLILPGNGVNVGEVFYHNGDFDAYQRTYVINDIKIFPRFLYYHLLSFWKERNLNKQFGSATNFLKIGNFLDYEVYYPEFISEQKRIVRILDEAFEKIEKANEKSEKNLQNSKDLFESYLQNFFANPMEDWKELSLGEVCEVITKGTTPTSIGFKFVDKGINFIKVESLTESGEIVPNKVAHISEECHKSLKRSQLKENDILFSIAGALGRIGIVTKDIVPANTNQALAIIRLKANLLISVGFIARYFNSNFIKNEIKKLKGGVAQQNLSLGQLNKLPVIIPPLFEQKAIVKKLDSLSEQTKKLEGIYNQKLAYLEELKKSILNKAFTGEL